MIDKDVIIIHLAFLAVVAFVWIVWPGSWGAHILAGLFLVSIFMELTGPLGRAVHRNVSIDDTRRPITEFIRTGMDDTRAILYHRPSLILIQVVKHLSREGIRLDVDGDRPHRVDGREVRLCVLKTQAEHRRRYKGGLRIPLPIRGTTGWADVAVWRLPSPKRCRVLEEVDCGASLRKALETVERMVQEDDRLSAEPRFDVWCEKGVPGWTQGQFEDLG
jgi:hypothetical protein